MNLDKHKELVKKAEKWLYKTCGCGVVFTELVTMNMEIPDAIGFRSHCSILVECKTSRADFLADAKKMFRMDPAMGVGDYRYFLCEEGLIKPDELPAKWGLLYYNGNKVKRIIGNGSNLWDLPEFHFIKDKDAEYRLMYSALRRINLRGDLYKIYENPKTELSETELI